MKPTEVIKVLTSAWMNRIKNSLRLWWLDVVQQAELIKLNESLPHQDDPGAYEMAMDIISDIDRIEVRTAILRTEVLVREARRLGAELPPLEEGENYVHMSDTEMYPGAWYLTPKGLLTVRGAIFDARKRQREGAMFWFGVFGTAFGMVMAIWKSLP